jgi:molybdopterin/thiamine biosynthesis adenylyltransferase
LPAVSQAASPSPSQRVRHSLSGEDESLSLRELTEAAEAAPARQAKSPLLGKFVIVAGLGAAGSMVADELARAGVGQLGLLDGGEVAAECVASGLYSRCHVGQHKATALATTLQANFPGLLVTPLRKEVAPGQSPLDALVAAGGRCAPDLVICCISRLVARLAISSWCVRTGTPLLDLAVKASKLELTMRTHLPASAPGTGLLTCLRCDPSVVLEALGDNGGQRVAPAQATPTQQPQSHQTQAQTQPQEPVAAAGDRVVTHAPEQATQAKSKPAMLAGTAAVLAGLLVQRAVRFLLLGTSSSERERYVTTYNVVRDMFEVAPLLAQVTADCQCRR